MTDLVTSDDLGADLGKHQADLLKASLVIFVTSTTGQGDLPKNTTKFWRNIRRKQLNDTNCLRNLSFALFGLGDSKYPRQVSRSSFLAPSCLPLALPSPITSRSPTLALHTPIPHPAFP